MSNLRSLIGREQRSMTQDICAIGRLLVVSFRRLDIGGFPDCKLPLNWRSARSEVAGLCFPLRIPSVRLERAEDFKSRVHRAK